MKLALIGYGAMGRLVEMQAQSAGDQIGVKVTSNDSEQGIDELAAMLRRHDAAIDFSVGEAVLRNIEVCALAGVPLVEGTTGWQDHESRAKEIVAEHGGALV
ncbi:MAG: 4-hydroxy-tetrahydrodipicolinate reductase, partial [bacterium]